MENTIKHVLNFPLVVYDGDCNFCRRCVAYAQKRTGGKAFYIPAQEVLNHFPDLAHAFSQSVYLFYTKNHYVFGAKAVFEVLKIGGHPLLSWFYRYLPGFRYIAEWGYNLVARLRHCDPLHACTLPKKKE